mgnify:CR=1 FL=1
MRDRQFTPAQIHGYRAVCADGGMYECFYCGGEIDPIEALEQNWCHCPHCNALNSFMASNDTVLVRINWAELKTLCQYAEMWAHLNCVDNLAALQSVQVIADKIEEQYPEMLPPLTISAMAGATDAPIPQGTPDRRDALTHIEMLTRSLKENS